METKPRICIPKSKIKNNDENKSVKGRQAGLRNGDVKDFKITPDKPEHNQRL